MADPVTDTPHDNTLDLKTRANLAYGWSAAIIAIVFYALYMYGHILAVLTLILGFATGTAATVLAVYFGAPIGAKKPDQQVTVTGDNPQVPVTSNPSVDEASKVKQ